MMRRNLDVPKLLDYLYGHKDELIALYKAKRIRPGDSFANHIRDEKDLNIPNPTSTIRSFFYSLNILDLDDLAHKSIQHNLEHQPWKKRFAKANREFYTSHPTIFIEVVELVKTICRQLVTLDIMSLIRCLAKDRPRILKHHEGGQIKSTRNLAEYAIAECRSESPLDTVKSLFSDLNTLDHGSLLHRSTPHNLEHQPWTRRFGDVIKAAYKEDPVAFTTAVELIQTVNTERSPLAIAAILGYLADNHDDLLTLFEEKKIRSREDLIKKVLEDEGSSIPNTLTTLRRFFHELCTLDLDDLADKDVGYNLEHQPWEGDYTPYIKVAYKEDPVAFTRAVELVQAVSGERNPIDVPKVLNHLADNQGDIVALYKQRKIRSPNSLGAYLKRELELPNPADAIGIILYALGKFDLATLSDESVGYNLEHQPWRRAVPSKTQPFYEKDPTTFLRAIEVIYVVSGKAIPLDVPEILTCLVDNQEKILRLHKTHQLGSIADLTGYLVSELRLPTKSEPINRLLGDLTVLNFGGVRSVFTNLRIQPWTGEHVPALKAFYREHADAFRRAVELVKTLDE